MVDLPKSIRVGYRDYLIQDWDRMEAQSAKSYGQCDNLLGIIRVCTDFGPIEAAETLNHELLHAAWYIGHLDESDKEERIVGVLASIMAQVWRDNPGVSAFMSASLAAPEVEGTQGVPA